MNWNNDEQNRKRKKAYQFVVHTLSKHESCESWSEGEEKWLKKVITFQGWGTTSDYLFKIGEVEGVAPINYFFLRKLD